MTRANKVTGGELQEDIERHYKKHLNVVNSDEFKDTLAKCLNNNLDEPEKLTDILKSICTYKIKDFIQDLYKFPQNLKNINLNLKNVNLNLKNLINVNEDLKNVNPDLKNINEYIFFIFIGVCILILISIGILIKLVFFSEKSTLY